MTVHNMDRSKTKIRRHRRADIPVIVQAITSEVPKLPHYQGIKVDPRRITQILLDSLRNDDQFMTRMLVDKDDKIVGGVCGYCVTQLLSFDKMTGDVFLFIYPEYRSLNNVLKLMMAYRDWGVAQGASIIAATQTGGYKQEQLGRLLERFGSYQPIGTIYYYINKDGVTPDAELTRLLGKPDGRV